ncbi:MAG: DUF2807 domain-containing protein [Flavobacteriia bacterium]|nr:DUF2807 domain-containing protein [Flavobacteriia bacterium]
MRYLVLLLFFSGVCLAQTDAIVLTTDHFKELKVYDGLSVSLEKGTENKLFISGEDPENVTIVNDNGVLKIKMKFKKMFSGFRTFVRLTYVSDFVLLDANEESNIEVLDQIKQGIIELRVQEGAHIKAALNVEQLIVKAVSGGSILLQGSTHMQDISINTGGVYKAQNLKSAFTTVSVNAGGAADIFAKDYVGATVKAGGTIKVFGDPKKMDEKKFFGGTIERVKN